MRKIFFIILCCFLLIGCTNPAPEQPDNGNNPGENEEEDGGSEVIQKTDSEILNELAATISIPTETDQDIILPTEYTHEGKTIYASWLSDNEDILNSNGKIKRSLEEEYVNLYLSLTLNETKKDLLFEVIVLAISNEDYASAILNTITIPETIADDLVLPGITTYEDKNYKVYWTSNNKDVISNDGEISYYSEDKTVTLTASINFERKKYTKDFEVKISAFDTTDMHNYLNNITFEEIITDNISLPINASINNLNYNIAWESDKEDVISNTGTLGISLQDQTCILTATMTIDYVEIKKSYELSVAKTSDEKIIEVITSLYPIPSLVYRDLHLPTEIKYGFEATWTSSDTSVITNDGKINQALNTSKNVNITLSLKNGDDILTHTYNTNVNPKQHIYQTTIFDGQKENVELNDLGQLVLSDGATTGTYYSKEIDHAGFQEVVASWTAISSKDATCELLVSAKVGDTYSGYVSYGKWGLGLKNACYDQSNSLIKLATDEVMVLNSKTATGIKFAIKLNRKSVDTKSPIVKMVTFAFKINNYSFDVDASLLKKSVKYDVPRLYQHDVPVIGNSICSITSSTMLLKFKGHDFSHINPLEHEYMAELFKDYGNEIFGNWVYNCVGMSAYGEMAYVKRFYSSNELLYSIQNTGPMAASIKGTVKYTSEVTGAAGQYTSSGHLLVVTGYEITDNGTYIFINDPNVRGVAIKMTLQDFLNVWRNVSYIVE